MTAFSLNPTLHYFAKKKKMSVLRTDSDGKGDDGLLVYLVKNSHFVLTKPRIHIFQTPNTFCKALKDFRRTTFVFT